MKIITRNGNNSYYYFYKMVIFKFVENIKIISYFSPKPKFKYEYL